MTHGKSPSIALLVSTYNWPEALALVLESVLTQEVLPSEVLIADDGSNKDTAELINFYRINFPVPLKHFWHEDQGFRKTLIMNKSIAGTDCEYIVQIDGDILLHHYFITDHADEIAEGVYIKGSRAMLTSAKTKEILEQKKPSFPHALESGVFNKINAVHIPSLATIFYRQDKRSDNFRGCNCAFWKKDFVAVNGYNNDLLGWGHEDIELAARFSNMGLYQKQLKMKAVCFHLYHPLYDRNRATNNLKTYYQTVKSKVSVCLNGYNQVKSAEHTL